MPLARRDPPPSEPLDPEFARVLRTADPGPAIDGPLTFLPPAGSPLEPWLQAWNAWRDGTLAGTIVPVLAAVARHADLGEVREILALDSHLTTSLEPSGSARSAAAGQRLLRRLCVARGERGLGKLQRAADAGQFAAHFPVVYAAQSVLFHLPLRLLVPGYAYWEWTAALSACPPLDRPFPGFSVGAAGLRALAETTLSPHAFDAASSRVAVSNAS